MAIVLKHRNLSIRSQLPLAFVSFTAVVLVLMTLFQVLFLDDVYSMFKTRTVRNAAQEIAVSFGEGYGEERVKYWNAKEQLTIYVVSANGEDVFYFERAGIETLTDLSEGTMQAIYRLAKDNGGEYVSRGAIQATSFQDSDQPKGPLGNAPVSPDMPRAVQPPRKANGVMELEGELMVCARVIDSANVESMVLVIGFITPLDTTAGTLAVQMAIASVFVIGFALAMALFVARHVAAPIVRVNNAAAHLADGQYVSPDAGGYREIDQLCETLDQAALDLKKSEQLQRELIANVSHDLRTPLTMITGYSEAIRDLPGEDSAENIQVVIDEADRLSRLVNDLLDLSRLQSGTRVLHKVHFDLTEAVEKTVDRCRQMTEFDGYIIHFIDQGHVCVEGDEDRLLQVVYNLLGNALRFTGEDKTVTIVQTVKDGKVRLSFSDSGKGIAPEELDSIWNRYYQVHSGDAADTAMHSGLGLSIVYNLVKLHGGQCGVESTVGKGTTFWFELAL